MMRRFFLTAAVATLLGAFAAPLFGQNTFSPNARVFDPGSTNAQKGAEPSIILDANDVIFATVPNGRVRLWRSANGGASWKFLGAVDGDIPQSGGDADLEFDALNRLYVADLVVGLGLSSTVSRYTNAAGINSVSERDFRTFTQPLQDRQWLATFGNETVYLAFHDIGPENVWVSASFDGGMTFLPAVPVITDPVLLATTIPNTNDGRIHTDKRTGAVYVTFAASTPEDNAKTPPFGPHRKIILARSFDNGLTWENFVVFEGADGTAVGNIFPGFAIDRSGNLYSVFAGNLDSNLQLTNTLNIFFTHSSDRGATWSRPVQVNQDAGSHVFPWAVAGCAGKVNIVWHGTRAVGNPNKFPEDAANAPDWDVSFAQTLDGLSATPAFVQTTVSDHVVHRGQVSTGGLLGSADRRLLDFFEVDHDSAGMAHLVWGDTGTTLNTGQGSGATNVFYSRQTGGAGILGCPAPQPEADVTGGGYIVVSGQKNNFGFNAQEENPLVFSGHLTYVDRSTSTGFTFKSTRITSLVIGGNEALISGDGLINNTIPTSFSVRVVDNGEPGNNDFFSITLGTGYTTSGTLAGGNIQIHP